MAARDVQCSLCRAIARDVFWSAAESRSRGQPANLPWLQTAVENSCKGQVRKKATKPPGHRTEHLNYCE